MVARVNVQFYSCITIFYPASERSFVDVSTSEHLLQRSKFRFIHRQEIVNPFVDWALKDHVKGKTWCKNLES